MVGRWPYHEAEKGFMFMSKLKYSYKVYMALVTRKNYLFMMEYG